MQSILERTYVCTQAHAHGIIHAQFHSYRNVLCWAHVHAQVAVTVLNSFMDTDAKHDAMSNKQVAEKMMESGLVEQVWCIPGWIHFDCMPRAQAISLTQPWAAQPQFSLSLFEKCLVCNFRVRTYAGQL